MIQNMFFLVASFSLSPALHGSEEYYVIPSSPHNTSCPQPCYTLDHYAWNPSLLSNKKNVSLLFLQGRHVLNRLLMVSDTELLLMAGLTDDQSAMDTTIECYIRCKIFLENILFLTVQNIQLREVLLRNESVVNKLRMPALTTMNVSSVIIEHCLFINSNRRSIDIMFNFNLSIIDCVFSGNEKYLKPTRLYELPLIMITALDIPSFILLRNATVVNSQPITTFYPVMFIRFLSTIVIEHSKFIDNRYNAILEVIPKCNFTLTIIDCVFNSNTQILDMQRDHNPLLPNTLQSSSLSFLILRNVTAINNHPVSGQDPFIIKLVNVKKTIIEDCKFIGNSGTVVAAYHSDIVLSGTIIFSNNTGIRGGALALYSAYILMSKGLVAKFTGNSAKETGGAIYVKQDVYKFYHFWCFYLLLPSNVDTISTLWFENNKAVNGGDDIYGGTLFGSCKFSTKFYLERKLMISRMFHFSNTTTTSSVTSDPTRVCLCDKQGTPQCVNMEYIYRKLPSRYPGEVFNVSVVIVGYDFGTVPGIVYSELLEDATQSSLGQNQHIQEVKDHRECTQLIFSIETSLTHKLHAIRLKVNTIKLLATSLKELFTYGRVGDTLLHQPVYVILPLDNCPTGFTLKNTHPYICTCHPTLKDNGITVCIITNHTGWVYRSGTVWVSDSFTGNETNSSVVHQYCPYDYCKPDNISVDLKFPDTQYSFNHSGVLCGGCYGNLSLALGTSKCLPCDNRCMSLLIVFILAGFILVFFIKILDLTVAKGTINGLILYANIVWANKSILFPATETPHPVQQVLQTFIAWLNLDLGIETCFIEGLDAYWKTWLQFVFPLYVWSITGVVIIASHYSTRASRIFGNNSVPVLATLILLSYAKLLRTIITSLGFSLIDYPGGTRVVWSFDGNIPYFGAAHTILFLVALAALLLLWLPYTAVLLTLQWLRRKSYLKALRWINRWKPFFDAYFGQLKPKHYYWIGLLLLVRLILLILFAATSAVVPRINIIAIAFTGVSLSIYTSVRGLVYKSRSLSLLEGSFIVNLTVLSITKVYMLPNDPANTPLIYTSIGVVFIEFLAIVIYHTWNRLKSTYLTYKRRHREENTPTDRELRVVAVVPHNHMHYREPLLDSSVQDK